ncbi:MAG: DUF3868 domain-containing protein [Bacteroidales bacterium]|nr:DUF3868 domain-containing protein [Bacteroidales bacterium]
MRRITATKSNTISSAAKISAAAMAVAAAFIIMVSGGVSASAQTLTETAGENGVITSVENVTVTNPQLERSGEFLKVGLDMDLTDLDVKANRAVLLTPHLVVNEVDSLDLPSIGIYGRTRYYFYVRNGKSMLTEGEESYKWKDKPDEVNYHQVLEYPAWAEGEPLQLHLRRSDYGCCNTLLEQWDALLAQTVKIPAYYPAVIYARPTGTQPVKERSISGSAFIDFVVNKTDIREDYHNNVVELRKIRASIDSVKNDPDITITNIFLKGFASPEGSYKHNIELAQGRTASLKDYVQHLYSFESGVITTAYEPEDWEGLRKYVESSDLEHRGAILDLIDGDLEPDPKEWKIKSNYPAEYKFLLANVYPSLRHTDYKIAYNIREYTETEELQAVYESHPDRLGPNEFYLLSQQYEPGSEEFTKVFETAVRYYPEDEASNLNAANAALSEYDFTAAAKYLEKAGDSGKAQYSRGVLAYWTGDFDAATDYMQKAKDAGVDEAADVLDYFESVDRAWLAAARTAALEEIAGGE